MAMIFDYENINNVLSTKIPSLKVINKGLCGNEFMSGLWISIENVISCDWQKQCVESCSENCNKHFKNLDVHYVNSTLNGKILGFGIKNPRMIILRRSPLLRMSATVGGKIEGKWCKGDGLLKNFSGQKMYDCVRRYLVIFVDENNKPLHSDYIQLTAKGTFQVDFDINFMKFRKEFVSAFLKSKKISSSGTMVEKWFSLCVFVPILGQRSVGKNNLVSKACFVEKYQKIDEKTWADFCVAKDLEFNESIMLLWEKSEKWFKNLSEFDDCANNSFESESL